MKFRFAFLALLVVVLICTVGSYGWEDKQQKPLQWIKTPFSVGQYFVMVQYRDADNGKKTIRLSGCENPIVVVPDNWEITSIQSLSTTNRVHCIVARVPNKGFVAQTIDFRNFKDETGHAIELDFSGSDTEVLWIKTEKEFRDFLQQK